MVSFFLHKKNVTLCHNRGKIMANSDTQKQRPAGVPEENVYNSMHWTVLLAYLAAAGALFLLLAFAG